MHTDLKVYPDRHSVCSDVTAVARRSSHVNSEGEEGRSHPLGLCTSCRFTSSRRSSGRYGHSLS